MFILLVFLGLIQGLLSSSPGSPCVELRKFMDERGHFPDDADDLAFRCPKMKSYLDCEMNYVLEQNSYHRLEELFGIRSLTNDLCDEDSKLHKDYVNNIACFKSVLDSKWSTCKDLGRDVYSEFRNFITALEDPDTPELDENERRDQSHCLVQSYAIACLGIQVMETCGADAYYAFLEIGLKSGGLKGNCYEYDSNLLNLDFADFLSKEMKHAHMDRINALFGYMKK